MPYGETFDIANIGERRKQRHAERGENKAKAQSALRKAENNVFIYAYIVAGILFAAALIMYWFVSPFAGLFVLILSVAVHVSSQTLRLRASIAVAQLNSGFVELLVMELFDDLQELLAKQEKRDEILGADQSSR